MNHVKKEALGSKQVGHIDVHHGLQQERKLNDPQIEMLAQTKSVWKRAVDEWIKWLNYDVEIKHDGNYRQQALRAEKPAIEPADVKRCLKRFAANLFRQIIEPFNGLPSYGSLRAGVRWSLSSPARPP